MPQTYESRKEYLRNYQKKYQKEYRAKNPKKYIYKKRDRSKYMKERLKAKKIEAYNILGGFICNNCGCSIEEILEINHINGGGYKERKKNVRALQLYVNIIKNKDNCRNFYNILCKVCNAEHYVKEILGYKDFERGRMVSQAVL